MVYIQSSLRACVAFVVVLVCLAGGCSGSAHKELPRLLRNVAAAGGKWPSCPPEGSTPEKSYAVIGAFDVQKADGLAVSPQLTKRLLLEFPPGSSEEHLITVLTEQGFELAGPCQSDSSLRLATFFQEGEGFLPYATRAEVWWKVEDARIVWLKGFISYSGL